MTILEGVKANLGLTHNARDEYIENIIKGAKKELTNKGIVRIERNKDEYDEFLIDYSAWMYRNRGGEQVLPKHLRYRRVNLIVGCINEQ